jgi:hypothetical protein
MRGKIILILLFSASVGRPQSADEMLARLNRARMYAAQGFEPVFCFAGQVKVEGKRLSREPYSVFVSDENMKCCGRVVKDGQTDQHGHFLVEPLTEGKYFAKFRSKGSEHLASFAVVDSYQRCGSTHLEINFPRTGGGTIQDHVDINDSGEDCREYEPQCYRK